MTDATKLPPLPEPLDYCYEWDGPYGTRKFSAAQHNGRKPERSVPLFNADQMHAYSESSRAPLLAEIEALRNLCDRLKQEAQIHAQEARTQKATVCECYQAATGSTGEPGDWNGAEPVRNAIEALRKRAEDAELDAERYQWLRGRVPGGTFRIMGVIYSEGGPGVDAAIDAAIKGSAA